MNIKNFDKVANKLFELAQEGDKNALLVYNFNWELSLNLVSDKPYIDDVYIIGVIDLRIYNTLDDIEEEMRSLISSKEEEVISDKINNLKKELLNKEISCINLDREMQSICYSEHDAYTDELLESGCISYTLLDDTDKHILVEFYVAFKNTGEEPQSASILKIKDIYLQ